MAFLSIIRRWSKREHVPIRQISRRTRVSRNTIRKCFRSDVIEPKFQVLDRPSKLNLYAEKLSAWLTRGAGRPRKQRRTAKQLYRDLVSLGYDGSYNRVAALARAWKEECQPLLRQTAGRGSFVPLAFQFDWSEDRSVRVKLQVAHVKLCYSRRRQCAVAQTGVAEHGGQMSRRGGRVSKRHPSPVEARWRANRCYQRTLAALWDEAAIGDPAGLIALLRRDGTIEAIVGAKRSAPGQPEPLSPTPAPAPQQRHTPCSGGRVKHLG